MKPDEKFRKCRAELWGVDVFTIDVPLAISEEFEYNPFNKIRIFEYRGRWGYCLRVWAGDVAGVCYGPFLSFCDPYPDRMSALSAAVNEISDHCKGSKHKMTPRLVDWAKSLVRPKQLRLI